MQRGKKTRQPKSVYQHWKDFDLEWLEPWNLADFDRECWKQDMSMQEVETVFFNIQFGLILIQSVQYKFILNVIFRYGYYQAVALPLQVAPQKPSELNYVPLCLDGSIIKMLFTDIWWAWPFAPIYAPFIGALGQAAGTNTETAHFPFATEGV